MSEGAHTMRGKAVSTQQKNDEVECHGFGDEFS